MNKPAAKEPSMDEILSSIRQIIADDDESAAPRRPSLHVAPDPMEAAVVSASFSDDDEDEPLALSSAQIVTENEPASDMGFAALLADAQSQARPDAGPSLVVPDDIGFAAAEPEPAPQPEMPELPSFDPAPAAIADEPVAEPAFTREPEVESLPMLSSFDRDEEPALPEVAAPEPVFAPRPTIAAVSPMPDSKLSADIADSLLETTTKSAVRSSIGKLSAAGIGVVASPSLGNAGLTIEAMVRDMLKPMLKEWLDENLPAVVERMVEKEIARVARGE